MAGSVVRKFGGQAEGARMRAMRDEPVSRPLYVEVHGDGPTTMLLLHGMAATGAVWRRVVDVLAVRWSGRVLVCDLPGHGASARLEDYSPPVVAAMLAREVAVGGPMVVVGHSFGGYLALLLASTQYGL